MASSPPLEIYLLTFNCGRALVDPTLLGPAFFSAWPKVSSAASLPDVVAVSLQEVAPIPYSFLGESWIEPYLQRIEESLHVASTAVLNDEHEEAHYERLVAHNVGMTASMVFVRKELRDKILSVETAGVGVGWWEMGNKGGVGIRLNIDGTDLTFVAMHLAPMEGSVVRRNQDWENICRGLLFEDPNSAPAPPQPGATPGQPDTEPLLSKRQPAGLYHPNSHIFLFGDLNYRTSHLPPTPLAYKTFPQPASPSDSPPSANRITLPDLFARDQLTHERLQNRVLHGFAEQPITFPPTYKYSHIRSPVPGPQLVQGDAIVEPAKWSWAHHRWPSWCDRILFYPPNAVTAHAYTALPLLPSSDHRPVALHVSVPRGSKAEFGDETTDLRRNPPFSVNPAWRERRASARRYEVVVGTAGWLTLTAGGNGVLLAVLLAVLGTWWLVRRFGEGV